MTSAADHDEGSRVLKVVEAISISPAEARALVSSHQESFRRRHGAAGGDREREVVSRAIIRRYARLAATSGGVTALAGVIPGVGTAAAMLGGGLADAAVCMKLQVDMVLCLAAVHDWDVTTEDAKHASFLIAAGGSLEKFGVEQGAQLASRAGVRLLRQYLRGSALSAVKLAFSKLGVTFTRAALEKAVPFGVGVAISSTANYGLTQYVGRAALKWFALDAEMVHSADHPGPGEGGGPAARPAEAPAP